MEERYQERISNPWQGVWTLLHGVQVYGGYSTKALTCFNFYSMLSVGWYFEILFGQGWKQKNTLYHCKVYCNNLLTTGSLPRKEQWKCWTILKVDLTIITKELDWGMKAKWDTTLDLPEKKNDYWDRDKYGSYRFLETLCNFELEMIFTMHIWYPRGDAHIKIKFQGNSEEKEIVNVQTCDSSPWGH